MLHILNQVCSIAENIQKFRTIPISLYAYLKATLASLVTKKNKLMIESFIHLMLLIDNK